MAQFTTLISRVVVLPIKNIDTDQIIPARYLKATDKNCMGDYLFADWRYNPDGLPKPDFVINREEAFGAQILLTGDNFGCGSSREHALWALTGFGFRAVISTSIADIFRNNAFKNGLLPVVLDEASYKTLFDLIQAAPNTELTIDLHSQTVSSSGSYVTFTIDTFNKTCLLNGLDELDYIMSFKKEIASYESNR